MPKKPAASSSKVATTSSTSKAKTVNGKKSGKDSESDESADEVMKSESDSEVELDDEDLARKLQEEEQRQGGRRTRKGVQPPKKESKKKSKMKEPGSKPRRANKYMEACTLSPQLAAIVGEDRMPRHQVVKTMWAIIKERNLMDPKNKQFMLCDEQMMTVFGRKKVRTFGMMKYLKDHIFAGEQQ
jgi:upstream activation factor subunit UAF30